MIYRSGEYAETGDRVKNERGELGTVVEVRALEIVIKWDKGVLQLEYPSGDSLTLVARATPKTIELPKWTRIYRASAITRAGRSQQAVRTRKHLLRR